jgi:uncharacterized protein HemX
MYSDDLMAGVDRARGRHCRIDAATHRCQNFHALKCKVRQFVTRPDAIVKALSGRAHAGTVATMDTTALIVLIVAIVVVIIIIVVLVAVFGRRRKREADRVKAANMRENAVDSQLDAKEREANAARAAADAKQAEVNAERLRREAASQQGDAQSARAEADEQVRKADDIDPDVRNEPSNRRHGDEPRRHS